MLSEWKSESSVSIWLHFVVVTFPTTLGENGMQRNKESFHLLVLLERKWNVSKDVELYTSIFYTVADTLQGE